MILIVSVLALVLSAATVSAWNEPDGFRGIPWGSPEKAVLSAFPQAKCAASHPTRGDRVCTASFTVAEIPVSSSFFLLGDKLEAVEFTFDSREFKRMLGVFFERYGNEDYNKCFPNCSVVTTSYATTWEGRRLTIYLLEHAKSDYSKGAAVFHTKRYISETQRRESEWQKKAKKDL